MTRLRKISALVLAIMMIAMVGLAYATVNPTNGSYEGSQTAGFGVDTSGTDPVIPITKSIVIFNPDDGTTVREPNLNFVYTVTPEKTPTNLGTITDSGNDTIKVNAGVENAIGTTTIQFRSSNTVSAKDTGTVATHNGSFSVDLSNFTHAGVYRYLITEAVKGTSNNTISDITTYGLEARSATAYEDTRYLDIYVINGSSGLELSSAVIFKTNTKDDSNANATNSITTTTDKTTGFEPGTATPASGDPNYTNDVDVDRYFTYNLKVGKTTEGGLADKSNDFPFEITLTAASTLVPTVVTDYSKSGASYEGTEPTTVNILHGTPAVLNPKMSNGDYMELKGIPKGTTVSVKETNNLPDVYTASWDTTAGTTSTATVASSNTTTSDLRLANNAYVTATGISLDGGQTVSNDTIGGTYVKTVLGYTNTLAEISPTGYVSRFAPYALILIGGVALLVIAMKKRKHTEED